ncbi:MAG: response regulator [Pseudomonadota bacterium]
MFNILLIDDEIMIIHALTRLIRRSLPEDTHIEGFIDPHAALNRVKEKRFDIIMSDYRMPSMNGIELLKQAAEIQPDASRLILSATEDFSVLMQAINEAEIMSFLPKPWEDQVLIDTILKAANTSQQTRNEHLLADERRLDMKALSPQEVEKRRLEQEEPGLTTANWNEEGAIVISENEAS